jgi:glycosyltransferase involved in cell wall biosynthesis
MKLLICTQIVDKDHPILGFFHRWIEEFAKNCEEVHVICLQKGQYSLPANVYVYSLGKEEGNSKLVQLYNFYRYIWTLRKRYDNVFVHMNQIYVILGGFLWRVLDKKIGLWYAHGAVSKSLIAAEKIVHMIFTSTEQGLQIKTAKKIIVGQGIDLNHFSFKKKSQSTESLKLITVGRISPSKNIGTLIDACALLKENNVPFDFTIVGTSSTDSEKNYESLMRQKVVDLGLSSSVSWRGIVPQSELPAVLQDADIFIQDGATQSLDKALLEAVACGCIVVSSNPSYSDFSSIFAPQYLYDSKKADSLAQILMAIVQLRQEERVQSMSGVRETLFRQHSIEGLISRIIKPYNN